MGSIGEVAVHPAIIITDDNGNAVEYSESGQVSDGAINWNTKIENSNYAKRRFKNEGIPASNKAGDWKKQFDAGVELKPVPEGMTQDQFEQAIRNTAKRYNNNDEYFPVPKLKDNTSNSNAFIGTILREVYYGGTDAMEESFKNRKESFLEILGDTLVGITLGSSPRVKRAKWKKMFDNAQPHIDYLQMAPGWDTDVTLTGSSSDVCEGANE